MSENKHTVGTSTCQVYDNCIVCKSVLDNFIAHYLWKNYRTIAVEALVGRSTETNDCSHCGQSIDDFIANFIWENNRDLAVKMIIRGCDRAEDEADTQQF